MMSIDALTKFWPLIYSTVQEFWSITEPHIEEAAIRDDVPFELYLYSELGLDIFSIEDFQKRDPFSNPEQFEKVFVRLNIKGWIEPMGNAKYQLTEKAQVAAREIIQAGDAQLMGFELMPEVELERLTALLKQLVRENEIAPQPPEKWAILKRFRVADQDSPWLVQIREYLLDLFAYRDDSYLTASRRYFNQAGIVWSVLGSLWKGEAITAEHMAEKMSFRGYDVHDYEVAIQAAIEVGWAEEAEVPGTFRPTQKGKNLREQAERLTNQYYYYPWSVLIPDELDELHHLLTKLRDQLNVYRKSR